MADAARKPVTRLHNRLVRLACSEGRLNEQTEKTLRERPALAPNHLYGWVCLGRWGA